MVNDRKVKNWKIKWYSLMKEVLIDFNNLDFTSYIGSQTW